MQASDAAASGDAVVRACRGQARPAPPRRDEVVVSLSPDRDELRPELEQLRRWFEARGGRLGALFETEGWSPNGVRVEGAVSAVQPPPAAVEDTRRPPGWLKAGVVAGVAAAILTAGAWLGQTWVTRAPAAAPVQAPATQTVTRAVLPETCLTALRQSDATVRLLRADVRDRRLDKAITDYQRSRDDCRRQAAGG
jgi:hypothetical protein